MDRNYNRTAMEVLMHLTREDRTLEEEHALIMAGKSKLNRRQREHVKTQMK
jgi:hypothetical protein